MDPNDITVAEAAAILGVSDRHVRWYHANGHLPGQRMGRWLLIFKRDDVEKLKANKPKKTGRPPRVAAAAKPKAPPAKGKRKPRKK
jgi:excisionase family DNA binding protein